MTRTWETHLVGWSLLAVAILLACGGDNPAAPMPPPALPPPTPPAPQPCGPVQPDGRLAVVAWGSYGAAYFADDPGRYHGDAPPQLDHAAPGWALITIAFVVSPASEIDVLKVQFRARPEGDPSRASAWSQYYELGKRLTTGHDWVSVDLLAVRLDRLSEPVVIEAKTEDRNRDGDGCTVAVANKTLNLDPETWTP